MVSIATLLPAGWSGVRILVRATDLSLLQNVQTGSAYHPAMFTGYWHFFPGLTWLGRDANH
jgi:hypothetical protein